MDHQRRIWYCTIYGRTLKISKSDREGGQANPICIDKVRENIQQHAGDANNGNAVAIENLYDKESHRLLQNMDLRRSSNLEFLFIWGIRGESYPLTIGWLRDDAPSCLQSFVCSGVRFGCDDCRILGGMISDRERALSRIETIYCTYPSLGDFFNILAGFVKDKMPGRCCYFYGSVVEDDTIPDLDGLKEDTLGFCRMFYGIGLQFAHERKNRRLHLTAECFLSRLRRFHRAGLPKLLLSPYDESSAGGTVQPPLPRQPEPREWVEVLAHDQLIGKVDLQFHLLTLNPGVYAEQALKCIRRSY